MPRDWEINRRINFSHNNQLYLKPQPRQVREVIGQSLPPPDSNTADHLIFGLSIVVAIVAAVLKYAV